MSSAVRDYINPHGAKPRHGRPTDRRPQELPWVRIDKEYRFETDDGSASLATPSEGARSFSSNRFMFGPDYTAGCPTCSTIADGPDAATFTREAPGMRAFALEDGVVHHTLLGVPAQVGQPLGDPLVL